MKSKVWWKKSLPLIVLGGAIPTILILGSYFDAPSKFTIPVVVILGLLFASMTLWAFANRRADGSEWWQDDDASGWRGY
jgi:hypothetical protein